MRQIITILLLVLLLSACTKTIPQSEPVVVEEPNETVVEQEPIVEEETGNIEVRIIQPESRLYYDLRNRNNFEIYVELKNNFNHTIEDLGVDILGITPGHFDKSLGDFSFGIEKLNPNAKQYLTVSNLKFRSGIEYPSFLVIKARASFFKDGERVFFSDEKRIDLVEIQ